MFEYFLNNCHWNNNTRTLFSVKFSFWSLKRSHQYLLTLVIWITHFILIFMDMNWKESGKEVAVLCIVKALFGYFLFKPGIIHSTLQQYRWNFLLWSFPFHQYNNKNYRPRNNLTWRPNFICIVAYNVNNRFFQKFS